MSQWFSHWDMFSYFLVIYLRNILLGIALAAPIGPAGLAVIQAGLRNGFRRAWLTGLGVTIADASYLLLVFFGLSRVMQSLWVQAAVWTFGAILLSWLSFQTLRSAWRGAGLDTVSATAPGRLEGTVLMGSPLVTGYLVNLSNPLAIVFWVGIFGGLLAGEAGLGRGLALLRSGAILVGILMWHTTSAALASGGRRWFSSAMLRWINLLAGLGLGFFAIRFAWLAVQGWLQL